jgi:hypothetical protein
MKFTAEFNWLETYLNNDSFWLEDTLNWDEAYDLVLSDYNVFSALTSAFFVNSHFFLDSCSKLSFLDVMFIQETSTTSFASELFHFFMWDNISFVYTTFLNSQFIFYTDYQDYLTLLLHHSPELSLALIDYVQLYWFNSAFLFTPAAVFDVFNDSLNLVVSEFIEYFVGIALFCWGGVFFFNAFRLTKWDNALEVYLVRLENYAFSFSREMRVQYEAVLKTFFFILFYFSLMIATFDDDQEEILEFINGMCFNILIFFFVYLVYKYSIHFFSFLEASVAEGRSIVFVAKQCLRDIINSAALLLRVLTLVVRLNIYDAVDDFLDSYYIFIGDFDDDEYFNDLFFSMFSVMFFDTDNNDDRSFFLEDEMDLTGDLFSLYFIVWGKFSLFFFFIVEEVLRVALALYITYLIMFEVQAVNRSYLEDTYFSVKKTLFNKDANLNTL